LPVPSYRSGRVLGNAAAEGPVLLRDWLAANTDAWIWYLHDFRRVLDVIAPWRAAGDGETFKPCGYGAFF
jgi:hypothetical protein